MSDIAIKVENLSKVYRLGEIGTGTLSRDLERWWRMSVLGQEDPFLKIGQTNDRSKKGESDVVYSLRDINFEIKQGEAVGIIGKNGAGKSTLLKILSRVTAPSTGRIHLKGRIASLLEVGTGFHPELTGRENIYLNGAILGMRKHEISSKLDEIIAFSGVERYIDTPVKRYSSGMYVRLAFAVAAHLESEILIVDEVLAVGDAEFQKKCLGKMGEVSRGQGRTILFVSHNMQAIRNLCGYSIHLYNGSVAEFGPTKRIVEGYLQRQEVSANGYYQVAESDKPVFISAANFKRIDGSVTNVFSADEEILIELIIQKNDVIRGVYIYMAIINAVGLNIVETDSFELGKNTIDTDETGLFKSVIRIPSRILNNGKYFLTLGIASKEYDKFQIESLEEFISFEVVSELTNRDHGRNAMTSIIPEWETNLMQ